MGVWRLEVYPDSLQIDDPFAPPRKDRLVFRLISRGWPMTIDVPGLGDGFKVTPLNEGNSYATTAVSSTFEARPGVYRLTSSGSTPTALPDRIEGVPYYLGMREFVCPASPDFPDERRPPRPSGVQRRLARQHLRRYRIRDGPDRGHREYFRRTFLRDGAYPRL